MLRSEQQRDVRAGAPQLHRLERRAPSPGWGIDASVCVSRPGVAIADLLAYDAARNLVLVGSSFDAACEAALYSGATLEQMDRTIALGMGARSARLQGLACGSGGVFALITPRPAGAVYSMPGTTRGSAAESFLIAARNGAETEPSATEPAGESSNAVVLAAIADLRRHVDTRCDRLEQLIKEVSERD